MISGYEFPTAQTFDIVHLLELVGLPARVRLVYLRLNPPGIVARSLLLVLRQDLDWPAMDQRKLLRSVLLRLQQIVALEELTCQVVELLNILFHFRLRIVKPRRWALLIACIAALDDSVHL